MCLLGAHASPRRALCTTGVCLRALRLLPQILDILAEAQQAVPEQLRQYASVAGGGGGGARNPPPLLHVVYCWFHTMGHACSFTQKSSCSGFHAPCSSTVLCEQERAPYMRCVWALRVPESGAGRRRWLQWWGFWRSWRLQALIRETGRIHLRYHTKNFPNGCIYLTLNPL